MIAAQPSFSPVPPSPFRLLGIFSYNFVDVSPASGTEVNKVIGPASGTSPVCARSFDLLLSDSPSDFNHAYGKRSLRTP